MERVKVYAQPPIQMRGAFLRLRGFILLTLPRVRYAEIRHHPQAVRIIAA
jgi:hypothetical protein